MCNQDVDNVVVCIAERMDAEGRVFVPSFLEFMRDKSGDWMPRERNNFSICSRQLPSDWLWVLRRNKPAGVIMVW